MWRSGGESGGKVKRTCLLWAILCGWPYPWGGQIAKTVPPLSQPRETQFIRRLSLQISKVEGFWTASTLPARYCNPGALKFREQPQASPGERGFAKFETCQAGWRALQRQLALMLHRGLGVSEIITLWAPPSENDTAKYLKKVLQGLH